MLLGFVGLRSNASHLAARCAAELYELPAQRAQGFGFFQRSLLDIVQPRLLTEQANGNDFLRNPALMLRPAGKAFQGAENSSYPSKFKPLAKQAREQETLLRGTYRLIAHRATCGELQGSHLKRCVGRAWGAVLPRWDLVSHAALQVQSLTSLRQLLFFFFFFFLSEPHGSGAGFRLQQRQHQTRTNGSCRTTQHGARQYGVCGTARPNTVGGEAWTM